MTESVASDRTSFEVLSPWTRQVVGHVPCSTAADVDQAVRSARSGFRAWQALSPGQREAVLLRAADIIGAASLEGYRGSHKAFDPRIQQVRPHPGQIDSAHNLRALLVDSEVLASHASCDRVQDAYSFRCMPQVHGATRDALAYVRLTLEREINSATDNPLVFLDGDYGVEGEDILSGGNFHGQPLAFALDYLAIGVTELGSISERRTDRMLDPDRSTGLTPFLATEAGVSSGYARIGAVP